MTEDNFTLEEIAITEWFGLCRENFDTDIDTAKWMALCCFSQNKDEEVYRILSVINKSKKYIKKHYG
jgi:hypothetical protein